MTHILATPAVTILAVVFFLIAVRQIGRFRFQIWQVMLLGAIAAILTGAISITDALRAINLDVLLFLFGMFVVGEALHHSGYLYHLSYRLFSRARTLDQLVLYILFVIGGLSALLMNDTLAIIGTPLVLYFARTHDVPSKALLLTLAFAITTGSVASPIGNPQNLLIAIGGRVPNPFVTFLAYLAVPTVLSLIAAFLILKVYYRDHFHDSPLNHSAGEITDPSLARLCRVSLIVIGVLIAAKILAVTFRTGFDFSLTYIAVFGALPILVFSPRRFRVAARIDWFTLLFFAAMFVLMEAVWRTGLIQTLITFGNVNLTSVPMILGASAFVSQLVSNVPFVALCLPMMAVGGGKLAMMALAAGSTIAGNMFILGAASNVIIIQNAEKEGETLTFWEFARIGLPLILVQLAVYWAWFWLVSLM